MTVLISFFNGTTGGFSRKQKLNFSYRPNCQLAHSLIIPSAFAFIHQLIYSSANQFIHSSTDQLISQSAHPFIDPSFHPFIRRSYYLFITISLSHRFGGEISRALFDTIGSDLESHFRFSAFPRRKLEKFAFECVAVSFFIEK